MSDTVVVGPDGRARCPWAESSRSPLLREYHDQEWGLPVLGEDALFERLVLEGFQAGLAWRTVLAKRDRLRTVFAGFVVDDVAAMTDAELTALMEDPGIIRNRAKIAAVRTNARATIMLRATGGLAAVIESHAPSTTPTPRRSEEIPTTSPESRALAITLKRRGFTFVGPTMVYALFEATGVVDTHLLECWRRGSSGRW